MSPANRARGQSLPEAGLLIALTVVMLVGAAAALSGTARGLYEGVASAVAVVNRSAPSGGASSAPTADPGSSAALLSVAQPAADQTINVSGSGFAPEGGVQAVLRPEGAILATGQADQGGNASLAINIPADIDLVHTHYIALVGRSPASAGGTTPILELDSALFMAVANPMGVSIGVGAP
jgi:hypothetical protein